MSLLPGRLQSLLIPLLQGSTLPSPLLCRDRCLQRMVLVPCSQVKLLSLLPVNILLPEFQSFLQNTGMKNFWGFLVLFWFCLFVFCSGFGVFFLQEQIQKIFLRGMPKENLKNIDFTHPRFQCPKEMHSRRSPIPLQENKTILGQT